VRLDDDEEPEYKDPTERPNERSGAPPDWPGRFLGSKAVAAATLSDAGRITEIAQAKHRFFEDRFRRAQPVISGAIARGKLPADTDPAELVRTLVAPIYLAAPGHRRADRHDHGGRPAVPARAGA
jgi:hypothetical protein